MFDDVKLGVWPRSERRPGRVPLYDGKLGPVLREVFFSR
jgi:hypothetical protein